MTLISGKPATRRSCPTATRPPCAGVTPSHSATGVASVPAVQITLPVEIVLAEHDQVERGNVLRPIFAKLLPSANLTDVPGAAHLIPLDAPQAVATACEDILARMK